MTLQSLFIGLIFAYAMSDYVVSSDSLNLLQLGFQELAAIDLELGGIEHINRTEPSNRMNLSASEHIISLTRNKLHAAKPLQATCTSLKNYGAYFSVELLVGTPPQRFDVVADTGSDAVIIPSCVCQNRGECDLRDRCYLGAGYSSTFHIEKKIPLVSMEFGSGTIGSAIATDIVRVGTTEATMKGGLLLMVDRQLDITGSFEGILGLGQRQTAYPGKPNNHHETWDEPLGQRSDMQRIPGFLKMAGVDIFSICFNDGDDPGVLRLNMQVQSRPLPSYGQMHWGLNFLGISIGDAKLPALFCHESEECGAIPDSGTTLMLGPEEHVRDLFRGICDLWPRCAATAKHDPSHEKEDHFQMLLFSCQDWMGAKGVEELPDIYLHFDGPNGGTTLEIAGWSYVFETSAEMACKHATLLGGLVSEHLQELQQKVVLESPNQYVCAPAFGADYIGLGKSALWILGTPLFYEYVVSFNIGSSPPTVGFSTDPCGSCFTEEFKLAAVNTTIALETHHEYLPHRKSHKKIRRIHTPLRVNKHPKEYVHHKS